MAPTDTDAGKLVFPGRRSARTLHWFLAGIFFVTLVSSVGVFAFLSHGTARIVFIAIGGVLYSTIIGMCLQNVFAASSTVIVESDQLSIVTPIGTRLIQWSSISKVSDSDQSTSTIRLRLESGGSITMRLYLIEDGKELGRVLHDRIQTDPFVESEQDQTFRPANRALLAVFWTLATFLFIGGGLFGVLSDTARLHADGVLLLVFGSVHSGLIGNALTRFVTITSSSLTFGSIFGKRTIPLSEIERVERTYKSGTRIRVLAGGAKFDLPGGLEDADLLLNRLLKALGTDLDSAPEPAPLIQRQEARAPLPDRLEFGVSKGFIGQTIFLILISVLLTAMGPVAIFSEPNGRAVGVGLVCTALFGTVLTGTTYGALIAWARYAVSKDSIERISFFRPWTLSFNDIESVRRKGANLSRLRIETGAKPIDIDLTGIKDFSDFVSAIESRITRKAPPVGPRKYAVGKGSMFLVLVGAFFVIAPVFTGQIGLCFVSAALGLALAMFGYTSSQKSYETSSEGIQCNTWNRKRFLSFADIKRVEIDEITRDSGTIRRMTLEHPEGAVFLSSEIDDFVLLEAFLREHIDSSRIHDSTGKGEFVKASRA